MFLFSIARRLENVGRFIQFQNKTKTQQKQQTDSKGTRFHRYTLLDSNPFSHTVTSLSFSLYIILGVQLLTPRGVRVDIRRWLANRDNDRAQQKHCNEHPSVTP